MNWKNLKKNNCPKCFGSLATILLEKRIECLNCKFSISQAKFDEIVNDIYQPKRKRYEERDNSSDLNNLGAEELIDND